MLYRFCWKFSWLSRSERILKIHEELTDLSPWVWCSTILGHRVVFEVLNIFAKFWRGPSYGGVEYSCGYVHFAIFCQTLTPRLHSSRNYGCHKCLLRCKNIHSGKTTPAPVKFVFVAVAAIMYVPYASPEYEKLPPAWQFTILLSLLYRCSWAQLYFHYNSLAM